VCPVSGDPVCVRKCVATSHVTLTVDKVLKRDINAELATSHTRIITIINRTDLIHITLRSAKLEIRMPLYTSHTTPQMSNPASNQACKTANSNSERGTRNSTKK
jgi:hypothetical protein